MDNSRGWNGDCFGCDDDGGDVMSEADYNALADKIVSGLVPNQMIGGSVVMSWPKPQDEKDKLIEELQAKIADMQFPINGMSATITPRSVDIWKTGGDSDDYLSFFLKHECDFCEKEALTLNMANDYMSLFVCRPCIVSMFTGAEILAK